MSPWQPLLDWWFGADHGTATEVAAARHGLQGALDERQRREQEDRDQEAAEHPLSDGPVRPAGKGAPLAAAAARTQSCPCPET